MSRFDDGGDLTPDAQVGLYRATVARAVTAPDELVALTLVATPDLAVPDAPWPSRADTSLPAQNEACYVAFADDGSPVVVAWARGGW